MGLGESLVARGLVGEGLAGDLLVGDLRGDLISDSLMVMIGDLRGVLIGDLSGDLSRESLVGDLRGDLISDSLMVMMGDLRGDLKGDLSEAFVGVLSGDLVQKSLTTGGLMGVIGRGGALPFGSGFVGVVGVKVSAPLGLFGDGVRVFARLSLLGVAVLDGIGVTVEVDNE